MVLRYMEQAVGIGDREDVPTIPLADLYFLSGTSPFLFFAQGIRKE